MQLHKTKPKVLRVILFATALSASIGLTATGCSGGMLGVSSQAQGAAYSGSTPSPAIGEDDVTRVAALLQVGVQQATQKAWQAASTTFQDVLAINPNNVYALYNLGVIDQATNNPAGAMGFYTKAIAVNGEYTPAMYNKAILLEPSDPQRAISFYQEIVGINPQAATAYLRMAFVQAGQGDMAHAKAAYAKAIMIDPSLGKYPLTPVK